MENLTKKQKIIIGIIILVAIIGIGTYFIVINIQQKEYDINDFLSSTESEGSKSDTIIIHITGEIINPGIIEIAEGARIVDAIEAAGVVTEDADLDEVNLAFVLSDSQKIYIPNKNEKEINGEKVYITSGSGNNVIVQDKIEGGKQQKVNINEAKQEDFEQLPGIGPSIAKKIVEYREQNGKFTSIEELQEVKGIGEAKFENIREYIMVK